MVARLASAGIGLPLLGAAVWFGSPWFTALAALVAALGAAEFSRLVSQSRVSPVLLSAPWAVALVLGGHAGAEFILPVLGVGLLASLVLPLLMRERGHALTDWALTVAGALYLGLPLSFAVLLRGLEDGRYWLLFVLLATFATDTGAYFVGRLAGRRRLAPTISPNKTWEGAVGGFIAAVGAAVAMSLLFPLPVEPWLVALFGAAIGIVAQLGDLAQSMLKRSVGAKDAGRLIPGHGGVLDRFDSVAFTLVLMYHLASLAGPS